MTLPSEFGEHQPPDPSATAALSDRLPAERPRKWGTRIASGAFTIVMVVFVVLLIPQMTSANLGDALSLITVGSLVVTQLLGLAHLVANWWVTTISLPGLSMAQAGVVGLSGAVVSNTFPSGGAVATGLTYAIDHSWGFQPDAITASIFTNGVFGQLTRYGLLAVGLLAYAVVEQSGWRLELVAIIVAGLAAGAVALLALVLRSERFARRFGRFINRVANRPLRLVHRGPVDTVDAVLSFRVKLSSLVAQRWKPLTWSSLVSQLTSVFVLGAALRMMGVNQSTVGWFQVLVAVEGAAIAAVFIPTPGGLGVTEAALLALLGYGVPASYDTAILAAVLLYRGATWLQSTVLGIPAYLVWRYRQSWRRPAAGSSQRAT
jgi:uncharacterized membrane protein YbhN (UPF0104 family)